MNESKILIIEDNKGIAESVSKVLMLEGMEVIVAEDGQQGVDKAKEYIPDIILCDIMMPIKDGYQVFNELYHDLQVRSTPFIFLTAKTAIEDVRQGMILGVDDYITKPFQVDSLVKSIKTQLKKEAERESSRKETLGVLQHNITRAIPHELLTPLNAIIGFSEMMLEPDYAVNQAEVKENLLVIDEAAKTLFNTIKKFIYYTEVELLISGQENTQALIDEFMVKGGVILENQSSLVARKYNRIGDLKLRSVPFNAKVYLYHFEIIIQSLIDNAFKFSDKDDAVEIDVQTDARHVHITICDNGVGFDPKLIVSIGAFSQFDRALMEQQGVGLGLITCINLIKFYKGNISFSSNNPKGTSVKVSFLLLLDTH